MLNNYKKIKIVFLGTPEFSSIVLDKLIKNNYRPVLVITAPDKPVGRKKIITPSATKVLSQKYKIPVLQPNKINDINTKIKDLKPDLGIVVAYKQIIPKDILSIPKYGFLNIHPSLLPKYRGPAPIQTALLNGDKKTGVTIILIDAEMDHGKIVSNINYQIKDNIIFEELSNDLAELSAELLIATIPKYINKEIQPKEQDESKVSFTKIIKKEDGEIDLSKSAQEIERQVRAFNPWPGSFFFLKKKGKKIRIKILEAYASESENPHKVSLKCKKDYLVINKLQQEGKKPLLAEEFKKGFYDNNNLC
jgi:methionyl-tRNA formyltransferase